MERNLSTTTQPVHGRSNQPNEASKAMQVQVYNSSCISAYDMVVILQPLHNTRNINPAM